VICFENHLLLLNNFFDPLRPSIQVIISSRYSDPRPFQTVDPHSSTVPHTDVGLFLLEFGCGPCETESSARRDISGHSASLIDPEGGPSKTLPEFMIVPDF
jgi:hypothetical protein